MIVPLLRIQLYTHVCNVAINNVDLNVNQQYIIYELFLILDKYICYICYDTLVKKCSSDDCKLKRYIVIIISIIST